MSEESGHQLSPASPTVPGQLIDAHIHLFTHGLFQEYVKAHPDANPVFRQAAKDGRFGRQQALLPDMTPEQTAHWYVERIKAAGVAKALLVSVVPDSEWTREFVMAAKGHIHALAYIDPRTPDAAGLIEREMAFGFRGAKLLPVNNSYRLSDAVCRPFLEKAASLRASMVVHYGVTVDPAGDLRYADPIDLSPVARDYPEITWVIAHFGAGWFDRFCAWPTSAKMYAWTPRAPIIGSITMFLRCLWPMFSASALSRWDPKGCSLGPTATPLPHTASGYCTCRSGSWRSQA